MSACGGTSRRPADRPRLPRYSMTRSTMPERVVVENGVSDGVALVTLNRPEVLNALDYQTLGELVAALETLDADDSVRCVVITGAGGRAFAAGADIKEMADATPVTLTQA